MKIAINGDIINTKDIYKVTKIQKVFYDFEFRFSIELFNNHEIQVGILEWAVEEKEYTRQELNKAKIKLAKFRQSIIDIWSENQSEIPQFNI